MQLSATSYNVTVFWVALVLNKSPAKQHFGKSNKSAATRCRCSSVLVASTSRSNLYGVVVVFDQEPPPQLRSLRQNNHARLSKSGRGTRLAIRAIQGQGPLLGEMPETWCQVCVLNVMRCESDQSTERAPPRAVCGVTGPQQGVALGVHMLHDLPQVGYLDGAPVPDDGEHLVEGIANLLFAPPHLPPDLHAVILGVVLALISGASVLAILEALPDGCGEQAMAHETTTLHSVAVSNGTPAPFRW